jgi:hypothetical protein
MRPLLRKLWFVPGRSAIRYLKIVGISGGDEISKARAAYLGWLGKLPKGRVLEFRKRQNG